MDHRLTLLLFAVCGLTVINTLLIMALWRMKAKLKHGLEHLAVAGQRLEREAAQTRYALATLRQLVRTIPPYEGDDKTDEEMLNDAVQQLDQLLAGHDENAVPPQGVTPKDGPTNLKDADILQFIKKAIRSNQIAVLQQPIVTLPLRQTRYYEVFSRIAVDDKGFIPANQFIAVAKNNNLMTAIDNLLLLRCLQIVKNTQQNTLSHEFFINISAQTLSHKAYISELIEFLAANPRLSSKLIFEMTQEDSLQLSHTAREVMEGLALLGCRFSMDQITLLGMDVNRLVEQNISFVKLDARNLLKEMRDTGSRKRIKKIKDTLNAQGINIIIEKVENEKQLLNLMDLHMDYGQGYLFGKPVLVD